MRALCMCASQFTGLRGTCASVVDDLAAPMPLAYVHFVQVVTDVVLVLAPFALFPRLGALSVLLSGILGLFYRGLLQLSRSFLVRMCAQTRSGALRRSSFNPFRFRMPYRVLSASLN